MIVRFISSLFMGLMLVLPLDFLFFIGLKKHYFDFYQIDEYFNVYFFDNQPFLWLIIGSLIMGFLFLYTSFKRIVGFVYVFVLIVFLLVLYKPIARKIGSEIFEKPNVTFVLGSQKFQANILYEGRVKYYLKRKNISYTIKIPKQKVKIL